MTDNEVDRWLDGDGRLMLRFSFDSSPRCEGYFQRLLPREGAGIFVRQSTQPIGETAVTAELKVCLPAMLFGDVDRLALAGDARVAAHEAQAIGDFATRIGWHAQAFSSPSGAVGYYLGHDGAALARAHGEFLARAGHRHDDAAVQPFMRPLAGHTVDPDHVAPLVSAVSMLCVAHGVTRDPRAGGQEPLASPFRRQPLPGARPPKPPVPVAGRRPRAMRAGRRDAPGPRAAVAAAGTRGVVADTALLERLRTEAQDPGRETAPWTLAELARATVALNAVADAGDPLAATDLFAAMTKRVIHARRTHEHAAPPLPAHGHAVHRGKPHEANPPAARTRRVTSALAQGGHGR